MLRVLALIAIASAGCETVFPLDVQVDAAPDAPPDCSSVDALYPVRIDGRPQSRYRIAANGTATWTLAEAACEADLAISHLFVPEDAGELAAMQAQLPEEQIVVKYWIGVARPTNSTIDDFRTVIGDAVPTGDPRWGVGEPGGTDELAVFINEILRMNDGVATEIGRFICECDDVPPMPIAIE